MRRKLTYAIMTALMLPAVLLLTGCTREQTSEKPPIHLNPNMDSQPKYKAQAESKYFADGATMRTPDSGAVARGYLRDDSIYYFGKTGDSDFIATMPVYMTTQLMQRGRERFDIYCAPCHSRLGDGTGIIVARGLVAPPTFHDERLRTIPDGQLFDVITSGLRNMPSYKHQIPVDDRWAIIAYMRALQRSHNATSADVPAELQRDGR
ncbi:MAG: cytochrome c [candidate division Zixibacteria bacterium]|nr:cytochrome c [candidate division Zixibacteria bacterium]